MGGNSSCPGRNNRSLEAFFMSSGIHRGLQAKEECRQALGVNSGRVHKAPRSELTAFSLCSLRDTRHYYDPNGIEKEANGNPINLLLPVGELRNIQS